MSYFYSKILELIQNATIEERVALLEVQVEQIQGDVTGLSLNLAEVDENVDFLFDEQVIQDERLFSLETETETIEEEVEGSLYWAFLFLLLRIEQAHKRQKIHNDKVSFLSCL